VTIVEDLDIYAYGPYLSEDAIAMIAVDDTNTAKLRLYDYDGNVIEEHDIRVMGSDEYVNSLLHGDGKWIFLWTDALASNTHVWTSTNNGASWIEPQVIDAPWLNTAVKKSYKAMVLAGSDNLIYFSTDGNLWLERSLPADTTLYSMDYSSTFNTFLLAAYNSNSGNLELYTAEGGGVFNWISRTYPVADMASIYTEQDITATNDRFVLYATTDGPASSRGRLLYRTDNFVNWFQMPLPEPGGTGPTTGIIIGTNEQNVDKAIHMAVDRNTRNTVLVVGTDGGGEG
jgi:hypothetical protein